MLILDEPTAGLDPHQIIETRDLIKGLAGEHTIILSTHILSEVEQTCERVVIIAKGKIVATDTVENLTSRLRGSEVVAIEVMVPGAGDPEPWIQSVREKFEKVQGVGKVAYRDSRNGAARFTVESVQGQHIRPELARAVIESGWQLNELHAMGLSLEEIFLQLTGTPKDEPAAGTATVTERTDEPAPESAGEKQ